MKRRRLILAFILMATWLAAAPQAGADPITFENMDGLLGVQDRPPGGLSPQDRGDSRVEIIDDGDVTGTIRDCGAIDGSPQVLSTGYPKTMAFVTAGGAFPLCCLLGICCPGRTQQPACANPPCRIEEPQNIPEPVTFTTLALGLGALQVVVLRRRGRKRLPNRP
jgi:hypothetical protein